MSPEAAVIERLVLFKLTTEYVAPKARAVVAGEIQRVVGALPMVLTATVGTPADEATAGSWDLALTVRVARLEDLEAFREHPDHRALMDDYLEPRLAFIKAWNFERPA